MPDVDQEILDEIRRAAFDLRIRDPQAAVRVLRRAAAGGGTAEVLARGALGEIYFEDLGDLDGALHEYRRVLELWPGLAAAELGLARVLRASGSLPEAREHYLRALASLAKDVASFRERREAFEPLPAGAEEVVLTLLEAALEAGEISGNGAAAQSGALDETLLDWAAGERLFDALSADEDDPHEDWVRFHSLRTRLRVRGGRHREAADALARAEADSQLPARAAASLRRDALEDASDLAGAAEQARRIVELGGAPALDVLRAAALTEASGDEPRADAILRAAEKEAETRLADAAGEERARIEEDLRRYREALAGEGSRLVGLRLRR
jgi:hypothetical protein